MRHASYTRKTWAPRYDPRGSMPCRNVTSTRRRTGMMRRVAVAGAHRLRLVSVMSAVSLYAYSCALSGMP
eukprot:1213816-Prymnesium_polylepis.1